jgi:uncharacterized membrane protein
MVKETEQHHSKKYLEDKTVLRLSVVGLILSILGIADSVYLTIAHYTTASILACPATAFINCAKVTSSSYSEILGIPVALLGLGFFVAMFFLQLPVAWRTANKVVRYGRVALAVSGIGMIFWLIFAELDRLRSICLFCTAAHILAFGLFVTVLIGTSITYGESIEKA